MSPTRIDPKTIPARRQAKALLPASIATSSPPPAVPVETIRRPWSSPPPGPGRRRPRQRHGIDRGELLGEDGQAPGARAVLVVGGERAHRNPDLRVVAPCLD